jgi:outer membrane receptor protein involved in Fe transport
LRYQEKQWESAGEQGLKVPSYMVWDLRFGCKILSADLYFEAQNLAGRRYADTYDVYTPLSGSSQSRLAPQPEQSFWAGLSIRFEN